MAAEAIDPWNWDDDPDEAGTTEHVDTPLPTSETGGDGSYHGFTPEGDGGLVSNDPASGYEYEPPIEGPDPNDHSPGTDVDPTAPTDDEPPADDGGDGGDEGDGGDGGEEAPPSQEGPFSKDYWSSFMDEFQHGFQGQIPQVSAGSPRAENAEVDAFQQYLMDQAKGHMENPSRYDAALVQQGMDVVNAQIDEMRRTGSSAIDARMAQRGLTGSSLEGEQHQLHEAALDRTANERAFNLQQDQARTWAQDRSSAFNMGLGAGQQAMTRDQQLMNQDIQNRALELQAQGMNQDAAFRQAQMDYDMKHGAARMGLDREGQLMDQDYRDRALQARQDSELSDQEWRTREQDFKEAFAWAGMEENQYQHAVDLAMWMMEQDEWDGRSFEEIVQHIMQNRGG